MMKNRLLYKYYANAFRFDRAFAQFQSLMRAVAHKNPRARVLEIGADTREATRYAMQTLSSQEKGEPFIDSWHFTDISSGFFEATRSEFSAHSSFLNMRFDKFDVEQNPTAQDFKLKSYDVVVACQMLHATKNMNRTMSHVRSLMKPGASLLLMETTQDCVNLQFIFGLIPEWWLSEEPERTFSPSLSPPMWQRVLKGAGFNEIDVELRDYESREDLYFISNMLSSVPTQPSKLAGDNIVVVISNKAPSSTVWLDFLRESIADAVDESLPDVQTLEFETRSYSNQLCIFVKELDQPLLHNLEFTTLKGIKAMATNCCGLL